MKEDNSRQRDDEAQADDGDMSEAEIDYNVMESFPASDPPSWTLGISPHKKERSKFPEDLPSPDDPSHQHAEEGKGKGEVGSEGEMENG